MSELPPLPPTGYVIGIEGDGYSQDRLSGRPAWDDDAMSAYAAAAVAAERERCAKVCEGVAEVCDSLGGGVQHQSGKNAANNCARLIRAGT